MVSYCYFTMTHILTASKSMTSLREVLIVDQQICLSKMSHSETCLTTFSPASSTPWEEIRHLSKDILCLSALLGYFTYNSLHGLESHISLLVELQKHRRLRKRQQLEERTGLSIRRSVF